MKLYRSDDEICVAGTVSELQQVRSQIENINEGGSITFTFDTSGSSTYYSALEESMIIKSGTGPALATYQKDLGIVVSGNLESLKSFASFFDFDEGDEAGCHNHWDSACGSDYVSDESLPIIVAIE
ncbi:Imm32 family immunity protein [Endozoicomonadaceae bacterium StTr2]